MTSWIKSPFISQNKNHLMLILILLLPGATGFFNIATPLGFHLHFFQSAIFVAALRFGLWGGFFSGGVGSLFMALYQQNPFILIFNTVLGSLIGYFIEKGLSLAPSVFLALLFQLPLIWLIDYYIIGLDIHVLKNLTLSLVISHALWCILIHLLHQVNKAYE